MIYRYQQINTQRSAYQESNVIKNKQTQFPYIGHKLTSNISLKQKTPCVGLMFVIPWRPLHSRSSTSRGIDMYTDTQLYIPASRQQQSQL